MSAYKIIGGDVGTRIVFTVMEDGGPLDISSASSLTLILIPPSGVLSQGVPQQTVTATFYTDGKDGNLQYTTIAGDVPAVPWDGQPQVWRVRPMFTLGGWTGRGEPDTFTVDP